MLSNLYALMDGTDSVKRIMSISLLWLEHIHTPETINELGERVSYYPNTIVYDVALSPL